MRHVRTAAAAQGPWGGRCAAPGPRRGPHQAQPVRARLLRPAAAVAARPEPGRLRGVLVPRVRLQPGRVERQARTLAPARERRVGGGAGRPGHAGRSRPRGRGSRAVLPDCWLGPRTSSTT